MDSYSTPRWLLSNTFKSFTSSNVHLLSLAPRKPIAKVFLICPADSPYAGGLFMCTLEVSYTRKVTLHFETPILHPNVTSEGHYEGSLSVSRGDFCLKQVLLDILQMLREPDWTRVTSPVLAEMYSASPEACLQEVARFTKVWAY